MPPGYAMGGPGPFDGSLIQLAVYGVVILFSVIFWLSVLALLTLPLFFVSLRVTEFALRICQNAADPLGRFAKLSGLVFRSLRRNMLRTSLTYAALFVLTGMLTLLYSVVTMIESLTKEKEGNLQVIMTERFSIPSMMRPGYANQLKAIIETKLPPESRPKNLDENFMTWSFVFASMDPARVTQENSLVFICVDPDRVVTMMNDLGINRDELGDDGYEAMLKTIAVVKQDKRNCIIGEDRLKKMGKQVGDEMKVQGINYKDLEFDLHIVGTFPSGTRNAQGAFVRADYLTAKLDEYRAKTGQDHTNLNNSLNLIWVRLPNKAAYEQLAGIVNDPATFNTPQVKLETASAAFASFLDPFKDIVWGMKFIIMPAIMVIMCLVVGITITIGVRERRGEMAVMKVIGFLPHHITIMIVAEAVLIGLAGSLLSSWCIYFIPEFIRATHLKTGVSFIDNFKTFVDIVFLGPAVGVVVGLAGALAPAASAQRVKASQIFAKIA